MSNPALMPGPATAGGFLLVIAIILPVIGMLLALALRGPYAERIALAVMPAGVAVAVAITGELWRTRSVLQYFV
jgi:multicomponent Na+:H+ antiporter subunit D